MTVDRSCPVGVPCPSGPRCPCRSKECVVEYVQPPRAVPCRPPLKPCPPPKSVAWWSTTTRDTFPLSPPTKRPKIMPTDHLGPLCGRFTSTKVHHEEFPCRPVTGRPEQALPRHALRLSTDPMRTVTTNAAVYLPPRRPEPAELMRPPDNLRHVGPSQSMTTYRTFFRPIAPGEFEPAQSVAPILCYRPSQGQMASRSEYRDHYVVWESHPHQRPEHEYRPPHPPMATTTTYTDSYVPRVGDRGHQTLHCDQPNLLGQPRPFQQASVSREAYANVAPQQGGYRPPAFTTTDTLKFCGGMDLATTTAKDFHEWPLQETEQHVLKSSLRPPNKPMQSTTTYRVDFPLRQVERTAPIVEVPGFCTSKKPMEGTTTTRASYVRHEVAPRPAPFYPPSRGLGDRSPMMLESLYRANYLLWETPTPDRRQHPPPKCLPPLDDLTETKDKYRAPGYERIICPPAAPEDCTCASA